MPNRGRITLTIILATLAILLLAQWQFPAARLAPDEWVRVIYLLGFLALIGGGMLSRRRISVSQAFTYSGIWMIIILALMIAYRLWQQTP